MRPQATVQRRRARRVKVPRGQPACKEGAYFHCEGCAPRPIGLGAGKEIGIGLLRAMLRQLGLSPRDLE